MSGKGHVNRQKYLRSCDTCGRQVPFHTLKYIGEGRYSCSDEKNNLTAAQLARHAARLRPLVVRPRRHAFIQGEVPTYLGAEARIYTPIYKLASVTNLLTQTGLGIASSGTVQDVSWRARYLADMSAEGERPSSWRVDVRTGALSALYSPTNPLLGLAGQMLFRQIGAPEGANPSFPIDNHVYGQQQEFFTPFSVSPLLVANAGLTYLFMRSLLGDKTWLPAAIRAGHWCRNRQREDRETGGFPATSAGGSTPCSLVGGPSHIRTLDRGRTQRNSARQALTSWRSSQDCET